MLQIMFNKGEISHPKRMVAMHHYALGLQVTLTAHANPTEAGPMKAYMRDQFEYLGIKTPKRRDLLKQFITVQGLPPITELDTVARDLWALPEREFQYTALGLIGRSQKKLPPEFIDTLEYLIITKSWWDTVDSIAGDTIGEMFKAYPYLRENYLPRWRSSDNFWLRRTCILFQLKYKKDTDFSLLCEIIRENLGSKEFFINKAIGWSLREYSKTDSQAVRDFVAQTDLNPLSAREAIKWLERKI